MKKKETHWKVDKDLIENLLISILVSIFISIVFKIIISEATPGEVGLSVLITYFHTIYYLERNK